MPLLLLAAVAAAVADIIVVAAAASVVVVVAVALSACVDLLLRCSGCDGRVRWRWLLWRLWS
eukprot:2567904-Alexandrium_andersonii.AAC.1